MRLFQKQLFIFIRKSALQECNVVSDSLQLTDKDSVIVRELHARQCKQGLRLLSFISIKFREQGTIVKRVGSGGVE